MLVDAHCHAHAFSDMELKEFSKIKIIAVSEDIESSRKTIDLSKRFDNIIPFIGIHPWNLESMSARELKGVLRSLKLGEAMGIGEVGVDGRIKKSVQKQIEVFKLFCEVSAELGLPMNIHALNAWDKVFEIMLKMDVRRALFHWYTGPIKLLKDIGEAGYYISINPAVRIQPKHRRILESAELDMIITESDGPYNYRGLRLKPTMISDLMEFISNIKDVDRISLEKIIERNFERLLG
ncbi:MAG: TatD family hydrolase [Thaumarchaeota archaeon]|nr:TatD family hydrolase [Nitrososphaerota archaeon]